MKSILIDGVDFYFTDAGALYRVMNDNETPKDILIPRFISGIGTVNGIADNVFWGSFSKIVINDQIQDISYEAFLDADVDEVFWPNSCHVIPYGCFRGSSIKHFVNVDPIEAIEELAFADTPNLNKIDLSGSFIYSVGDSAFLGKSAQNVRLPYYVPDKVVQSAFI